MRPKREFRTRFTSVSAIPAIPDTALSISASWTSDSGLNCGQTECFDLKCSSITSLESVTCTLATTVSHRWTSGKLRGRIPRVIKSFLPINVKNILGETAAETIMLRSFWARQLKLNLPRFCKEVPFAALKVVRDSIKWVPFGHASYGLQYELPQILSRYNVLID